MSSTANIKAGLGLAKTSTMDLLKFIINKVAVPILSAVILGFIIFFIFTAIKKHREGENYQDHIWKIIVALLGLALVATFPYWGWVMVEGVSTSNETSSTGSATSAICMLLTRGW